MNDCISVSRLGPSDLCSGSWADIEATGLELYSSSTRKFLRVPGIGAGGRGRGQCPPKASTVYRTEGSCCVKSIQVKLGGIWGATKEGQHDGGSSPLGHTGEVLLGVKTPASHLPRDGWGVKRSWRVKSSPHNAQSTGRVTGSSIP